MGIQGWVSGFWAALLGLVYVWLGIRTQRLRRELRIPLGDGGDPRLLRAVRVHANFAEYVPMTLVLLLMLELQGAHRGLVQGLGACLFLGRLSHAFGVGRIPEDYRYRVLGMALTFTALGTSAVALLALTFLASVGS